MKNLLIALSVLLPVKAISQQQQYSRDIAPIKLLQCDSSIIVETPGNKIIVEVWFTGHASFLINNRDVLSCDSAHLNNSTGVYDFYGNVSMKSERVILNAGHLRLKNEGAWTGMSEVKPKLKE